MRRVSQGAALGFVAVSVFVVWESWNLEYYTNLGPGGGFFPLWLGVVMGGLSLAWFAQVSREKRDPEEASFLPDRGGLVRILSTLAALVAIASLMELFGYQITMFLFLVFLLRFLGGQALWVSLVVAVLGSVGVYHLFGRYLDVPLPAAGLKFLAPLGL